MTVLREEEVEKCTRRMEVKLLNMDVYLYDWLIFIKLVFASLLRSSCRSNIQIHSVQETFDMSRECQKCVSWSKSQPLHSACLIQSIRTLEQNPARVCFLFSILSVYYTRKYPKWQSCKTTGFQFKSTQDQIINLLLICIADFFLLSNACNSHRQDYSWTSVKNSKIFRHHFYKAYTFNDCWYGKVPKLWKNEYNSWDRF